MKKILELTIESNRRALTNRELREIIYDVKIKVDVVMAVPVLGNEAAYFIAGRRRGHSLVNKERERTPAWFT